MDGLLSLNYYNRHIGDYAKQTAHLSFAEDGAYNRMLDYYYASELPLPLDTEALYRKVRARSKPERAMIDQLLSEFFRQCDDGWHKGRCDEEIERYQEKAEKNRVNGASGGRPKKPNGFSEITHMVSKNNPEITYYDNPKITLANNQEPVASSQEPVTNKKQSQRQAPATRLPPGWSLPDEWKTWAIEAHHIDAHKAVRISLVFRDYWYAKAGKDATKQDWFATWRNWIRRDLKNG